MTAPNCAVFESIPDRFLDCPAERLAELLPGPCLMDLPGRERRPLFVSVLLHGNEDTGLAAAQEVLRRHLSRELHRSLLLFVGNVAAAAANVRTLPGQADYNRVWPGTPTPDIPEAHMARWVFDYAASRRPFASIEAQNWALALAVGAHSRGPDGDEGWRRSSAVQAAAIKPLPGAIAATASIKTRRRSPLGLPATPQLFFGVL
jgi:hypothetical protein